MTVFRVKKITATKDLGWVISQHFLKGEGDACLQGIGAGALNQGIKAIIEANVNLALSGKQIAIIPAFVDIMEEEKPITGIKLILRELR